MGYSLEYLIGRIILLHDVLEEINSFVCDIYLYKSNVFWLFCHAKKNPHDFKN